MPRSVLWIHKRGPRNCGFWKHCCSPPASRSTQRRLPSGRLKTPGRPLTFGTTEAFLSQFSLEALSDLPGLEELKGTGLVDSRLPSGFSVPTPSDDPALRDDEDPLEIGDLELALAPAAEPEGGGEN